MVDKNPTQIINFLPVEQYYSSSIFSPSRLLSFQMEARSVTHLQGLNKGLEIKIIELQLRLDEGERERMAAQDIWNNQKINYEQVYMGGGMGKGTYIAGM